MLAVDTEVFVNLLPDEADWLRDVRQVRFGGKIDDEIVDMIGGHNDTVAATVDIDVKVDVTFVEQCDNVGGPGVGWGNKYDVSKQLIW